MRLLAFVTGATFLASVSAHATFQQLWINGVDAGSSCVRLPKSNSPIENVLSDDLACNAAGTSSGVCSINAGDEVTVEMHQQNGDRSCKNEAIGGNHYGPVTVYMAQVPDAKTAVGSSADWFKVSESGLVSNNSVYWAVQVLNDNCGHYTFKVPSDLAAGNYLIRAEVLALHVAGSVGGAQFYPACFQVNVAGSGTAKPPTVKIPGAFSATDPGILFNLYGAVSTYQIPGPTPYGTSPATVATTAWPTTPTWNTALQPSTVPTVVPGVGSGTSSSSVAAVITTAITTSSTKVTTSSSTVIATPTVISTSSAAQPTSTSTSPSSSAVAPTVTSSTAVTIASSSSSVVTSSALTTQVQSTSTSSRFITSTIRSSSAASTPSNSVGTVPLYGQCGGLNHKGPTVCAEGTCTYSNDWYSQCILVPW